MKRRSKIPFQVKPKIFIGSSQEGVEVAANLKKSLGRHAKCVLWSDPGLFKVSEITIDNLEKALDDYTYAIIVMSPDDRIRVREQEHVAPRDNLIFELGLFVGRHGRRSAFMVVPAETEMRLPSDLLGITTCHYRIVQKGEQCSYDVSEACHDIVQALKQDTLKPLYRHIPSKFWDQLSNRIRLVFGVEYAHCSLGESKDKDHPKISLRDLNTATLISSFLSRRYPQKIVFVTPSTTLGWQSQVQPDEDIILIGGFVTNSAYMDLYRKSEQHFRVKMGRLCAVDSQRVFHLGFKDSREVSPPPKDDSLALETFPSKYITRDFGLVTSKAFEVYGHRRRVITIAGIKGNGTQGAAMALIREPNDPNCIDEILPSSLRREDSFELLVESRTNNNTIDETNVVELVVNHKWLYPQSDQLWESCEFNQSCEGCKFGLPSSSFVSITGSRSDFAAIIFDLDDTLVETFHCLITPLEKKSARRMIETGMGVTDADLIAEALLQLRVSEPDRIEEQILLCFPGLTKKAIEARRAVFETAYNCDSLTNLITQLNDELNVAPAFSFEVSPTDKKVLQDLARRYVLYLVTIGPRKFQELKIDYLSIRNFFKKICVLDPKEVKSKRDVITSLAKECSSLDSVLVVGNRLDHEIRIGNDLGMNTVWICKGEGSSQKPSNETGRPDHTVYSLSGLRSALDSLRVFRAQRLGQRMTPVL